MRIVRNVAIRLVIISSQLASWTIDAVSRRNSSENLASWLGLSMCKTYSKRKIHLANKNDISYFGNQCYSRIFTVVTMSI